MLHLIYGRGYGDGDGHGDGHGNGNGNGDGYGDVSVGLSGEKILVRLIAKELLHAASD